MSALTEAYAEFLQEYPWDYYLTVTYAIRRNDAIRAAGRVWALLEATFLASRAFIGVEPHKLGGIHIHALTRHAFSSGLRPQTMEKYFGKAFGFTTCGLPREIGGAAGYVTKYVTKGGQYSFHGTTDAWKLDDLTVPLPPDSPPETARVEAAGPTLWQPALPGLDS